MALECPLWWALEAPLSGSELRRLANYPRHGVGRVLDRLIEGHYMERAGTPRCRQTSRTPNQAQPGRQQAVLIDRKSVVEGKSVSVRVDLGGRRSIKKKKKKKTLH